MASPQKSTEPRRRFDLRPSDHIDAERAPGDGASGDGGQVIAPSLSVLGWARWGWRQLTSMRTALILLLLVAIAAVPGSLFPQRSSNPNGVVQKFREDPVLAETLDALGLFTVYTSPWFSAIYLLLFASLIGCVIPRTRQHLSAVMQPPPRTPSRLSRLPAHHIRQLDDPNPTEDLARSAHQLLRRAGYRVTTLPEQGGRISVSAERGYARETGNLVFHVALIGILATVAIGSGFAYAGQRVVVEGQTFVNARSAYDTLTSGTWFNDENLPPFSLTLDDFEVSYVEDDPGNLGFITDYTADVSITDSATSGQSEEKIRVNEPLSVAGAEIYLLGNGYAPEITVRDAEGTVVFSDTIPFLPQDSNLTSLGIVKIPDGLSEQVGAVGFFYPTQTTTASGAYASVYPDLQNPVMTLNIFTGDLGIDGGVPRSVYAMDTSDMTQLTGGTTGVDSLELRPGESVDLPSGLGSIELGEISRFASFDIAHDPTKIPVLVFTLTAMVGLGLGLFVPRRRVWFRFTPTADGRHQVECAGLARGDDPGLDDAVLRLLNQVAPDDVPSKPRSTT